VIVDVDGVRGMLGGKGNRVVSLRTFLASLLDETAPRTCGSQGASTLVSRHLNILCHLETSPVVALFAQLVTLALSAQQLLARGAKCCPGA